MNSSKIRHWLAQASMTYYDVTRYVSDHPMIYHPVNVGKHQREMSIGDPAVSYTHLTLPTIVSV